MAIVVIRNGFELNASKSVSDLQVAFPIALEQNSYDQTAINRKVD